MHDDVFPRERNMLLLIYRRYALAAVPALDCEKMLIEKDKVRELKILFEEMNSDEKINFGRLLAYLRYIEQFYVLSQLEWNSLEDFLRLKCPTYFPSLTFVWWGSLLIKYFIDITCK